MELFEKSGKACAIWAGAEPADGAIYANLTLGISMVFTIRKWETVIFEKTVYKMVWQKPF